MPIEVVQTANENSSGELEFTIKDYGGIPVSVSNISTATYSLVDSRTGAVINSRTTVNLKPYIDANGVCVLTLTALDNVIMDERSAKNKLVYETHLVLLKIAAVVDGKTISLEDSIAIKVKNITHV